MGKVVQDLVEEERLDSSALVAESSDRWSARGLPLEPSSLDAEHCFVQSRNTLEPDESTFENTRSLKIRVTLVDADVCSEFCISSIPSG